jgi:cyclase
MVKKRLIFKLLLNGKKFCLSRNFKLQEVGNINWLYDKMQFSNFANYLDELIVININKNNQNSFDDYINLTKKLIRKTFIPVTLGGNIYCIEQVKKCFEIGADKIIITSGITNKDLIKKIISTYGSQALICGIDIKVENKKIFSYIKNGEIKFMELNQHINLAKKLKFGELFINSIDKDGTGTGFLDPNIINNKLNLPLIWSGGAGKSEHFEILKNKNISALATGNLFNFLGDGLPKIRNDLLENKVNVKSFSLNKKLEV